MAEKTAEELLARSQALLAQSEARRQVRAEQLAREGPNLPRWVRFMDEYPPSLRAAQAEGRGRMLDRGKWGFMIYQGACYTDPARWERYRVALEELWEKAWTWFDDEMVSLGAERGVATERVKGRMALTWIEDKTLDGKGIEQVRVRFKALQDAMPDINTDARAREEPWMVNDLPIPFRRDRDVCLYVDEDCVSSLIGPPSEQETETETHSHSHSHNEPGQPDDSNNISRPLKKIKRDLLLPQQKTAYILAVDGDYDSTNAWYPRGYEGYVKIWAFCLFTDFIPRRIGANHYVPMDRIYSEAHELSVLPSNGIWKG